MPTPRTDVRNVAIVAHVDHGKTTLVDGLLELAGAFRRGAAPRERALDSGDLERERGITITSKPTALDHRGVRINIVDTPGHADFGGEVERVLNMVDAVLLLVDAVEGPMPQTRFVTEKAISQGLPVILAVNKIDRPAAEPHKAVDATFDLLVALGADDDQLDFPVVFCSARERYAMADPDDPPRDLGLLLDTLVEHVPPPAVEPDAPAALWVSTLYHDPYVGFMAVGRIAQGRIDVGDRMTVVRPGSEAESPPAYEEAFRVRKIFGFAGVDRFELEGAAAGDIVAVAGMNDLRVGDTLTVCDADRRTVFPALRVDPPTMSIRIRPNDGPFAGREGTFVTSRKIEERLAREVLSNVALEVHPTDSPEEFDVRGRGELHLSVLLETMRREGYEMCVSRPEVLLRRGDDGGLQEPYERAVVTVDEAYVGNVIDALGNRGGELSAMEPAGPGRTRLTFRVPSRGLLGFRSELLSATRGSATMASTFEAYGPYLGPMRTRSNGVMVVLEDGETVTYSLHRLQDRGTLFVGPQTRVYAGMIIGEHNRPEDIVVNPAITKKLTNIRAAAADDKLFLSPPRIFSLEEALAYLEADELLEITPTSLRLRKRHLDHNVRKREEKARKAAAAERRPRP
ncbi:MAG: translational GTPase TypA [Deltaproteobacteria bacterium]|nr:MAG: translational GTPase TypA [Deltaproteobacteria bacterium]